MAVPDTNTFALTDVTTEIGLGATASLQDCFDNASGTFDPTYEGAKDRQSNFRNYAHQSAFFLNGLEMSSAGHGVSLAVELILGDTWSVSFWVNTAIGNLENIFAGSSSATTIEIDTTGTPNIRIKVNVFVNFTIPIPPNERVHICITDNGGLFRVYVNGVEASSTQSGAGGMWIKFITGASLCIVDEVAIYDNIVASQANVTALYNGGEGAEATSVIASPEVYYKMNESGTDTIAVDSSGNNNNGTLTGFPASGMWIPFP